MNRVIHDLYNHEYAQNLDTSINLGAALTCSFNSSGQVLYVGTSSGEVIVFDTNTKFPLARFPPVNGGIVSISSTLDQEWLVSASTCGVITRYYIPSLSIDCQVNLPIFVSNAHVSPMNKDICIITPSIAPSFVINFALEKNEFGLDHVANVKYNSYDINLWINSLLSRANLSLLIWSVDERIKLPQGHPMFAASNTLLQHHEVDLDHLPEGFQPIYTTNDNYGENNSQDYDDNNSNNNNNTNNNDNFHSQINNEMNDNNHHHHHHQDEKISKSQTFTPTSLLQHVGGTECVFNASFSPLGDKIAFGTTKGNVFVADVSFLPNIDPNPTKKFNHADDGNIPGMPIIIRKPSKLLTPNTSYNNNNNNNDNNNNNNNNNNNKISTNTTYDNTNIMINNSNINPQNTQNDQNTSTFMTNNCQITANTHNIDTLLNTVAIFPNGLILSNIIPCTPPPTTTTSSISTTTTRTGMTQNKPTKESSVVRIQFSSQCGVTFGDVNDDLLIAVCHSDGRTIVYNTIDGSPISVYKMDRFPIPTNVDDENKDNLDEIDTGDKKDQIKSMGNKVKSIKIKGAKKAVFTPTNRHIYLLGFCDNHTIGIGSLQKQPQSTNDLSDYPVTTTSDQKSMKYLFGPLHEQGFDICAHPFLPMIVTIPSTGRILFWSTRSKEVWTAFNPVFQALEDNVEYVELESDFDVSVLPTHQGHVRKQYSTDPQLKIVNFNPGMIGEGKGRLPTPSKLLFYYKRMINKHTQKQQLILQSYTVNSDPILDRPLIKNSMLGDLFMTNLILANITHKLDHQIIINNPTHPKHYEHLNPHLTTLSGAGGLNYGNDNSIMNEISRQQMEQFERQFALLSLNNNNNTTATTATTYSNTTNDNIDKEKSISAPLLQQTIQLAPIINTLKSNNNANNPHGHIHHHYLAGNSFGATMNVLGYHSYPPQSNSTKKDKKTTSTVSTIASGSDTHADNTINTTNNNIDGGNCNSNEDISTLESNDTKQTKNNITISSDRASPFLSTSFNQYYQQKQTYPPSLLDQFIQQFEDYYNDNNDLSNKSDNTHYKDDAKVIPIHNIVFRDPTSGFFLPPATVLHFLNSHIIPIIYDLMYTNVDDVDNNDLNSFELHRKTYLSLLRKNPRIQQFLQKLTKLSLPQQHEQHQSDNFNHILLQKLTASPHTSLPLDPLLVATALQLKDHAKLTPFHQVIAQNNLLSGIGAAVSAEFGMNPFNRMDSYTTLGRGAGHDQLSNPIYTLQHVSVKRAMAMMYPMVHGLGIFKDPFVPFTPGKG